MKPVIKLPTVKFLILFFFCPKFTNPDILIQKKPFFMLKLLTLLEFWSALAEVPAILIVLVEAKKESTRVLTIQLTLNISG